MSTGPAYPIMNILEWALKDPAMLDRLSELLEKNPDLAKKFFQIPQVRQGFEQLTAQTIGGYATLPALLALLSSIFTDKPIVPILLSLAGLGITHFFPEVREKFNVFNLLSASEKKQEGPAPKPEQPGGSAAVTGMSGVSAPKPEQPGGSAAVTGTSGGSAAVTGTSGGSAPESNTPTALTYPFAPQTPGTIGSVGEQTTVPSSLLSGRPESNAGRVENSPSSPAVNNLMKKVINSLLVNPVQRLQDVVYSAIRHIQPASTQTASSTSSPSESKPPALRVPWANPQKEP